jgi:hypothetical protein
VLIGKSDKQETINCEERQKEKKSNTRPILNGVLLGYLTLPFSGINASASIGDVNYADER